MASLGKIIGRGTTMGQPITDVGVVRATRRVLCNPERHGLLI